MTSTDRIPADRIAAVDRYGSPITPAERYAATALLETLLDAAAGHGVALADFDAVIDLPGGCLDVTISKMRNP